MNGNVEAGAPDRAERQTIIHPTSKSTGIGALALAIAVGHEREAGAFAAPDYGDAKLPDQRVTPSTVCRVARREVQHWLASGLPLVYHSGAHPACCTDVQVGAMQLPVAMRLIHMAGTANTPMAVDAINGVNENIRSAAVVRWDDRLAELQART